MANPVQVRPRLQLTTETRAETVTSSSRLQEVVAAATQEGRLALDTEFLREKTYRARLCLVQLATRDEVLLVDVLTGMDLAPLARVVGDPDIEIVVHAGRQDFEILYEAHGIVPSNVFDVQLAAAFVGLGSSLPYGRLIEMVCGIALTKGESYTDWCRRPLTAAQLRYAADDVRYLLAAADDLKRRLDERGRLDWAKLEMRSLEDEQLYVTDPDEAWRRVGGRGSLNARHLGMLKELAAWREREAARRDIPRGWVLKDTVLLEICRRRPRSAEEMKQIRGMSSAEAERSARAILAALEKGAAEHMPVSPRGPGRDLQQRARIISGLADALVRSRCERAGIAPEVVVTRSELESVLLAILNGRDEDAAQHRVMSGWRKEFAGEAIAALARGRTALKVVPEAPYITEVGLGPEAEA